MRVVLLVTDLQPGGTPLRIARLARGLRAAGDEVHVGCLAAAGGVSQELVSDGVPTFACGARGWWDLVAFSRLAAHLRRIRPTLVHATLFHANVAARLVGRRLGLPVLGSTATIEVERHWHRVVERLTIRWECGHLVTSRALQQHVVAAFGVAAARVHVIPPSLDPRLHRTERSAARRALGLPSDAFILGWAGRFDPVKRLERLLDFVAASSLDTHALLVGAGPESARIAAARTARGLAARVHLVGWQSNSAAALSAADVFVLPSRTEGLPNALLEALAIGLPVIASELPALRALRADGAPLELVPPESSTAAWLAAWAPLRSDPNLSAALGNAAAAWAAENLRPERTIAALRAVYASVVERTAGV